MLPEFLAMATDEIRLSNRERQGQGFLSRCVVLFDLRQFDHALPDCEKALQLNRSADSLYFTAAIYARAGQSQRAILLLEEACSSREAIAQHFELLAELEAKNGDIAAAHKTLQRGSELFPVNAQIRSRLMELPIQ